MDLACLCPYFRVEKSRKRLLISGGKTYFQGIQEPNGQCTLPGHQPLRYIIINYSTKIINVLEKMYKLFRMALRREIRMLSSDEIQR